LSGLIQDSKREFKIYLKNGFEIKEIKKEKRRTSPLSLFWPNWPAPSHPTVPTASDEVNGGARGAPAPLPLLVQWNP